MALSRRLGSNDSFIDDELGRIANSFISHIHDENYESALDIFHRNTLALWFAIPPSHSIKLFKDVAANIKTPSTPLNELIALVEHGVTLKYLENSPLPAMNEPNAQQVFTLVVAQIYKYRREGHVIAALSLAKKFQNHLGQMQTVFTSADGWSLHASMQVGISAMLAGDCVEALAAFTRAQLHPPVPRFSFLARDARIKAALIHAFSSDSATAKSLLQPAMSYRKTSSWLETEISAHQVLVETIIQQDDKEVALEKLASISMEASGELWPFYVVACYRTFGTVNDYEEIEQCLETLDKTKLSSKPGEGFTGSVMPLKRALLAMREGHGAQIQSFIDQADPDLTYTQLMLAASYLYAGQPQQAAQLASQLRKTTRGFRLLELRRIAILAASQYQAQQEAECITTLQHAVEMPKSISLLEVPLFSVETQRLAIAKVPTWPAQNEQPSIFLSNLPKAGPELTSREIEIVGYLSEGHTRTTMAEKLNISVNTLKTHLRSTYKKLDVSSAQEAISSAQQRGLL